MKLVSKSRFAYAALVLALAAVLAVLAVLQYRWSREVSEAASVRMQSNLQAAIMGMRQDFTRELAGICSALEVRPDTPAAERLRRYSEQLESWKSTTTHPGLLSGLYLWQGGSHPRFLQFNGSGGQPQPGPWPQELDRVRGWIQQISLGSRFVVREHGRQHGEGPHVEMGLRAFGPTPNQGAGGMVTAGPMAGPLDVPGRRFERRMLNPPCLVAEEVPALICPAITRSEAGVFAADWLIIKLDPGVLRDHIFAELAERYFGGPDGLSYRVAVVSNSPEERHLVYTSDSDFDLEHLQNADASITLFGGPGGPFRANSFFMQPPLPAEPAARADARVEVHAFPRLELLRYGGPRDWELVVQHRNGSLEQVVAGMRRRNLAISFGVLLVLAITMAVMVISSHRAQRLAQLQMDFVAAVSHELRTPLAVISSAADNMTHGVVGNPQQTARYGKVIKTQARQLIQLVEQVLLFASMREARNHHHVRALAVDEVVNAALDATSSLVHEAGFTVDKQVEPGLPQVMGDLGALSQCLQNLITNAVKYGGDHPTVAPSPGATGPRWIGVHARQERGEVQISVEDHGPGIPPDELSQIFEPFYRCAAATAAQIHGTGLGLPLARSIAHAMGGVLTVTSELGHGSCFTLHLPSVEKPADEQVAAAKV